MRFEVLTPEHVSWCDVKAYAENCPWRAGPYLAKEMDARKFSDWERVIAAFEDDSVCGYCTVAKTDCIPDVEYTPYVGFVFVDEAHRGRRISQKMIDFAAEYLKTVGFDRVYLVSDHVNLYEKYGFNVVDKKIAPWGSEEKIYMRKI